MSAINVISEVDVSLFSERPNLNEYQRLATRSAIYPGQGTPLGLDYVALKLNGEAGEVAEHVGKAMRDDNLIVIGGNLGGGDNHSFAVKFNELTPERHALLVKEAGDCLWYLSALCNELNMKLSQVALINLEKLADRSRRNALRGSGDER